MKVSTARAAVIASVYAVLTVVLSPISYGPIQVRVADALGLLPYLLGFSAVIGLTAGCAIANAISPYGIWDVALGSLTNFIGGSLAWAIGVKFPRKLWSLILAAAIEIAVTTLIIGYVLLHLMYGEPAFISVPFTAVGSTISYGILGVSLTKVMEKRLEGSP